MTLRRIDGRVSIVVLNWNSGSLGAAAVGSALAQDHPDVEVIVVDNASSDDSLEQITNSAPSATVIRNDANLGFGGGMNVGITRSSGEFVIALNCDAELDPDYVSRLHGTLTAHPNAAAAGGRVRSPRVRTSGPLRITRTMRTAELDASRPGRCDKLNGACPMWRCAALDQVVALFGEPYDSTYFTYGEDIDLARTLDRLGWEFRYDPDAGAQHVRSFGSAPRLADRRGHLRVTTLTNRHRNIVRHAPDPWWATEAVAVVQDIGFLVLRIAARDRDAFSDVLRAWRNVRRTHAADRRRRRVLERIRRAPA